MQDDRLKFQGKGFSREPLTPDELAQSRERAHHYDRHFLTPDQLIELTGLKRVQTLARGIPAFLLVASMGSAVLVLRSWGIF